jgi:hypothetical protein
MSSKRIQTQINEIKKIIQDKKEEINKDMETLKKINLK